MAYFLGTWNVENVVLSSQSVAETPTVSAQEYERLDGTGFVVLRSKTASLPEVQLAVLGYDPRQRIYVSEYFTAPYSRVSMAGKVSGNIWTWISRDGQLKQTIHMLSPSAFTRLSAFGSADYESVMAALSKDFVAQALALPPTREQRDSFYRDEATRYLEHVGEQARAPPPGLAQTRAA